MDQHYGHYEESCDYEDALNDGLHVHGISRNL